MPNSNIAIEQGGNALLLGGRSGNETRHTWDELQTIFASDNTDEVSVFDDFLGAALSSAWAINESNNGSVAVNAQAGGAVRLTTDVNSGDNATLALGLHWTVSNGRTIFEARVKQVSAITTRIVEIGLNDALSETGGEAFTSHDATPVAATTDGVMFGYDTGESMTTFSALSVKAGGTPQVTLLSAAPSTSYKTLRIEVDSSGVATFYVDGVLVATHTNAVATTAVLTPWISLVTASAAAKSMDVDYVRVSAPRG